MRKSKLLEKLEEEAEKKQIIVRYEPLGLHKGGLCKLFGRYFLFVNKALKTKEKEEFILASLEEFSSPSEQKPPRDLDE